MKKFNFNAKGSSAPAYSCNQSGDNSGEFYRVADVDKILEELRDAKDLADAGMIDESIDRIDKALELASGNS